MRAQPALELDALHLADALAILVLVAEARDPSFEHAAARWVGRLLTEDIPFPATRCQPERAHRVRVTRRTPSGSRSRLLSCTPFRTIRSLCRAGGTGSR